MHSENGAFPCFCLFNCKNTLCKGWLEDLGAVLARAPRQLGDFCPDLQLQEGLCATRQSLPVFSELGAISAEWS